MASSFTAKETSTQLHSLNKLVIKATEETQAALIQFLNYIASNPDATITYRASDIILSCDSAAGLSLGYGKCCYLPCGTQVPKQSRRTPLLLRKKAGTQFNGPIYVLAKVIKTVMGQDQQQKLKLVDYTWTH